MPKVSVLMPNYNYSAYVAEAIQSVLDQTFTDFQLVISDDCSTDASAEVIRRFTDPRIRFIQQEHNLGLVGNYNTLVMEGCGDYLAFINSDDVWKPDKLGKQVALMEEKPNIGACFTQVDMIGNAIPAVSESLFCTGNQTNAAYLRQLYLYGNLFCYPSVLLRASATAGCLMQNGALRQLPDFDLWCRLLCVTDVAVVEEKLTSFRFHKEVENISTMNRVNGIRAGREGGWILADMITALPDDLFREAFSEFFRDQKAASPEALRCERYFLMLDVESFVGHLDEYALRYYYQNAQDPAFLRCMEEQYRYTWRDLHAYTGRPGPWSSYDILNFRNSLSWRITKPLRAFADLLARCGLLKR